MNGVAQNQWRNNIWAEVATEGPKPCKQAKSSGGQRGLQAGDCALVCWKVGLRVDTLLSLNDGLQRIAYSSSCSSKH